MVNKITTPPTNNEVIDKVNEIIDDKQDTLVSCTNIKTVNGNSLLGSGNIAFPTVNNAALTIQKNSTNVATFTANASSNVTANISVPTKVSDLTNDSGFITSSALSGYQTTANLVTSVSSSSTDSQYPSAKCVYDIVGDIETALHRINSGGSDVNLSWYKTSSSQPDNYYIKVDNEIVTSGNIPTSETLIDSYANGSEIEIYLHCDIIPPYPGGPTSYNLYVNNVLVGAVTSSSNSITHSFILTEDTVIKIEAV